jgi:hypothetical protein
MRHMAHSCVTSGRKKTLESPQCNTVLAQKAGPIAVVAKKHADAGAYV